AMRKPVEAITARRATTPTAPHARRPVRVGSRCPRSTVLLEARAAHPRLVERQQLPTRIQARAQATRQTTATSTRTVAAAGRSRLRADGKARMRAPAHLSIDSNRFRTPVTAARAVEAGAVE